MTRGLSGTLSGQRVLRVLLVAALALALVPLHAQPAAASAVTPIMGSQVLTASQLAAWFNSVNPSNCPDPRADASIGTLARYFIEEGANEGIRGDIAFLQSVLETCYFYFPSNGQVRPSDNNYGGLGAVDGGNDPNRFETPRLGVRAQIHHLRAYADPNFSESSLASDPVTPLNASQPRFNFVTKGIAPAWDDLGSGKWASDPHYASKILHLYREAANHAGVPVSFLSGDAVALSGDWNGDGRANVGWFDRGRFHLRFHNSAGLTNRSFSFGRDGDIPIVGDWNGDGITTVGVIRGRRWYLRDVNRAGSADRDFIYGRIGHGDYPIIGDWNGNGQDTVGVVRDGRWHLRNSNRAGHADHDFRYGRVTSGDVPLVGDWDGNGIDTPAIVRGREWHIRFENRAGHADRTFNFGRAGDAPVAGDWNRSGQDGPGIVRGVTWHLRNPLQGGQADISFPFGG